MSSYTVVKGDSLSKIAAKVYGDYHLYPLIADENNIDAPYTIRVGQVLQIPEDSLTPITVTAQYYQVPPIPASEATPVAFIDSGASLDTLNVTASKPSLLPLAIAAVLLVIALNEDD